MTLSERITRMCQAAVATEKASGCPAEMLVAQCAVESGWLQNAPANNALGYKHYPGAYGRQLLKTTEWFTDAQAVKFADGNEGILEQPTDHSAHLADGRTIRPMNTRIDGKRMYAVRDWFATFPSLEACFARRAERWQAGQSLPWVKAFHQTGNIDAMLRAMASGYATAPDYADSLLAVLKNPEVKAGLALARAKYGTGKA